MRPSCSWTSPERVSKVEPSVVIRGSLVPPVWSELCVAAKEAYELFVETQRLDLPDLYAGKLCAALDRQHPRDLFDVMHLQASGPIPDSIRQAFVAYLAGHRRPIAELLQPNRKPIENLFGNHFAGMTEERVELAELEAAREQLFERAASALTDCERRFLLSVKQADKPSIHHNAAGQPGLPVQSAVPALPCRRQSQTQTAPAPPCRCHPGAVFVVWRKHPVESSCRSRDSHSA
jgi:hypothetical protein